jgi:hypothetical protein
MLCCDCAWQAQVQWAELSSRAGRSLHALVWWAVLVGVQCCIHYNQAVSVCVDLLAALVGGLAWVKGRGSYMV